MEKQKLSLTEMLQIAGRVDTLKWQERPDWVVRDLEEEFSYPKKTYTIEGFVRGLPIVVISQKNCPSPFNNISTVDSLRVDSNGFLLGAAYTEKSRGIYVRNPPLIEDINRKIRSVFEDAKIRYIASERKRELEALDLARKLITGQ